MLEPFVWKRNVQKMEAWEKLKWHQDYTVMKIENQIEMKLSNNQTSKKSTLIDTLVDLNYSLEIFWLSCHNTFLKNQHWQHNNYQFAL